MRSFEMLLSAAADAANAVYRCVDDSACGSFIACLGGGRCLQ